MDAQSKQIILGQIKAALASPPPTGPYLLEALNPTGWKQMESKFSLPVVEETARLRSKEGHGRLMRITEQGQVLGYYFRSTWFAPEAFTAAELDALIQTDGGQS